jgi:hypothetical protein
MSDSYDSERDVPDFVEEPEAEYVELEHDAYGDPEAPTVPSGSTVRADRVDAVHDLGPDRPPTDDEEEAAERGAQSSPDVSDPYEEALHRGADIKGEGQILPD